MCERGEADGCRVNTGPMTLYIYIHLMYIKPVKGLEHKNSMMELMS